MQELHELVNRVHNSIGYLMVLGEQLPIPNDSEIKVNGEVKIDEDLKKAADKAEQMARGKSSVTSAL